MTFIISTWTPASFPSIHSQNGVSTPQKPALFAACAKAHVSSMLPRSIPSTSTIEARTATMLRLIDALVRVVNSSGLSRSFFRASQNGQTKWPSPRIIQTSSISAIQDINTLHVSRSNPSASTARYSFCPFKEWGCMPGGDTLGGGSMLVHPCGCFPR